MSLAAFPWRDRPTADIAREVWRVVSEHGAPCSVYVGNVFVTVRDRVDLTDPQYVGTYGHKDSVGDVMRALNEALADLRGWR